MGILHPPVYVDDHNIRNLFGFLNPGFDPVFLPCPEEDQLAPGRQAQAVCQLGHPNKAEGDPIPLQQANLLVIRFILISTGGPDFFRLPIVQRRCQPGGILIQHMVIREIRHIEPDLFQMIPQFCRRIEARISRKRAVSIHNGFLIN